MTDEEYLHWVEKRIVSAFYPPFGAKNFFNRELFEYVLDKAGDDVGLLNGEMEELNRQWSGPGQSVKLRVDNAGRAIKLKVYTPTRCAKASITPEGIDIREMAPSE